MLNKLFLSAAVAAAAMFVTAEQASANHGCYRGHSHHHHRSSVGYHRYSPHYTPYRSYRVPSYSYFGYGYGYSPRVSYYGFGSPFYGRNYYGARRSGITIGFGW
jgi:hypothetical protein